MQASLRTQTDFRFLFEAKAGNPSLFALCLVGIAGQQAALARSEMNDTIPFDRRTEQTTETMLLAPKQQLVLQVYYDTTLPPQV